MVHGPSSHDLDVDRGLIALVGVRPDAHVAPLAALALEILLGGGVFRRTATAVKKGARPFSRFRKRKKIEGENF